MFAEIAPAFIQDKNGDYWQPEVHVSPDVLIWMVGACLALIIVIAICEKLRLWK